MADSGKNTENSEKCTLNCFYLLKRIVELRAEHTRWSGAITLFISIFVASFIALLSTLIELQSPNLLSDTKYDPDKTTIKGDSLNIISTVPFFVKNQNNNEINIDTITSKDTIFIKNQNNNEIKLGTIILPDTFVTIKRDSKVNGIDTIFPKDSIFINKRGYKSNEPDTVKIKKFKFNYVEERPESKYKTSANQILFSCTTVLSFIFTLFIYIIRRKVEIELEEIENNKKYKYILLTDFSDNIYIDFSDSIDNELGSIDNELGSIDSELGSIDSDETLDDGERKKKKKELEEREKELKEREEELKEREEELKEIHSKINAELTKFKKILELLK